MDNLTNQRHTLAHLLAAAVLELYPDTKPTIGPAIDNGFYYDLEFTKPLSENDLGAIEAKMKELLPAWTNFTHEVVTLEAASERYQNNPYKLELIKEINEKGEGITLYTCGGFTDLCRGGHSENPAAEITPDSFKLDRIAGAYWRGDEKNKMLTRIYGLAFNSKEELEAYLTNREEAADRDHKKLGKELDLFFIDEKVGKGLPMWTPKGTAIKFELENFTRDLERKYGYEHVSTPYLGAEDLYRTSGHLDHYSHNMYAPIDMDGDLFYLRPMACPHHIRMFQRKAWSYRDLPIRYAEIADYNRYEKSGELMGMIRVRKFQLTDAHIFVAPEGLKDEFKEVCSLIKDGMQGLGLEPIVSYRFSRRDPNNKEKYFPDDELWNKAEAMMKEALDEVGISYIEALDEAAFYGPKLDVQAKNVNGKEDTLFTAQIDFLLPQKFDIEYTDSDGKKKRPVMIHRSAIGSLERTFAFLIEHYAGSFPLWLSPVQVAIVPVTEAHEAYAKELIKGLQIKSLRVKLLTGDGLGKRIRAAKTEKIPYTIVIGDKEKDSGLLTLESRDGEKLELTTEDLLLKLETEIKDRK